MSNEFIKALAILEFVSGLTLLCFSLWLIMQSVDTFQSHASLTAIKLGLFSVTAMGCGALLRTTKVFRTISQWIFTTALVMAYIEFCTRFSGWYL